MIYTSNGAPLAVRQGCRLVCLLLQPHVRLVDGSAGALAEHAANAAATEGRAEVNTVTAEPDWQPQVDTTASGLCADVPCQHLRPAVPTLADTHKLKSRQD